MIKNNNQYINYIKENLFPCRSCYTDLKESKRGSQVSCSYRRRYSRAIIYIIYKAYLDKYAESGYLSTISLNICLQGKRVILGILGIPRLSTSISTSISKTRHMLTICYYVMVITGLCIFLINKIKLQLIQLSNMGRPLNRLYIIYTNNYLEY